MPCTACQRFLPHVDVYMYIIGEGLIRPLHFDHPWYIVLCISTYHVHCTRLAALRFSSYFELLFFMYSNSFGMKLKRKLLAIISYSRCPSLIFARYFYYIWILWRSSATHRAMRFISVQTSLHLKEFLWTRYVRSILCYVLNVDRMKSQFSSSRTWQVLLLDWNL
jgi:hypothetical protein